VKHPVACGGAGEERDPHLLAQDLCTENIKQQKKLNTVTPIQFSIKAICRKCFFLSF
jgi:hypothetical protein